MAEKRSLNKRFVDSIVATEAVKIHWDGDLPGFGIRVSPGGTKAWVVQWRDEAGRTRREKLGDARSMSPEKARAVAKDVLAAVRLDEKLPLKREGGALFGEVLDEFLKSMKVKRAPRTAADYEARINRGLPGPDGELKKDRRGRKPVEGIRARFGARRIRHISRLDVEKYLREFVDRPQEGNHMMAILSAVFGFAAKTMRAIDTRDNPVVGLERYAENKRERALSEDEIKRFGTALAELENAGTVSPWAAAALRLLMLTGGRSGEILGLKWSYVDFDRAQLNLPTSKTGAKVIKLSPQAVQVLRVVPKIEKVDYVIAGRRHGEPMKSLQRPFTEVVAKAGIAGLRIHDLRHTVASIATSGGIGLPVVGRLLGQSQAYTTARYSHINDGAERGAAAAVGELVGPALGVVVGGKG